MTTPATTHDCPADGCHVQCDFDRLACPRHWRMVSRPTQRALLAAWRYGPVAQHLAIRQDAVDEINAAIANRAKQLAGGK